MKTKREPNPPRNKRCAVCLHFWKKCICKQPGPVPFYLRPAAFGGARELSGMISRLANRHKTSKVWEPSNVYDSAKLGRKVNVGTFCEIGANVIIGDGTRVGAFSFIPEGVTIGKHCFIGPRVTFTNDKFPPGPKSAWLKTVVEDGARIGAAVTILPGVTIRKGALIGSGAVVTKNVPAFEIWAGVPARRIGKL